MNKWQREILGNRIASEETILEELKSNYKQALKDIEKKLSDLMRRLESDEGEINRASIEYQLGYQKSLQTQIKAILEQLNTQQFESISAFLQQSYEDGFIGTMYDLQHQGIPLTIPIDQKQVIKALKNDTKLSKGLWGALAEKTSALQTQIRGEISRGLSQGFSYSKIARFIAERMNIDYNKTSRIVRTESHRISQEATLDAQHKAKDKGADVVKQWDATLDGRTRKDHRKLDGQIRELDEPFEIGGHKAMCPGKFNRPEQDVNCRCTILQRAKWALDDDELETLKERAKYFELDKTKDFEEYKEKYLKADKEIKISKNKFTIIEEELYGKGFDEKLIDENIERIVELTEKYPKMKRYLEENSFIIDGIASSNNSIAHCSSSFRGEFKKTSIVFSKKYFSNKEFLIETEKKLVDKGWNMPCSEKNLSIYTITHEYGHAITNVLRAEYIQNNRDEYLKMKEKTSNTQQKYMSKIVNSYLNEIKKIALKEEPNLIFSKYLSEYGKSNVDEAFAEIFANSQCGEPNILGRAMNKWLEGVME